MCEFFSACITADRVFWLPRSNSHEDIIDAHKLHVDGARGPNAVRAELTPPKDPATVADLETWRYRLDQDTRPDWYDGDDAAERMRGAADVCRQIDPVMWRVQTAASRRVCWTGEQRAEIVGKDRIVLPGVQLSRANLSRANLSRADLSRASLYGANLSRANLYGADLSRADLSGAELSGANLYGANLYGANLSRANLYGANLSRANLSGAYLSRANLSGADLSRADLSRADLYGAYYPSGNLPAGWVRDDAGHLRREARKDVDDD